MEKEIRRWSFLIAFHFLLFTLVFAQDHGDCIDARELVLKLDQRIFDIPVPAEGPGKVNEISAPRGDKYFFRQEHHTHWYTFVVPFNGMLSLEIRPYVAADDYDFLLFQDSTGRICEQIQEKSILPIRSVISRNDKRLASRTGLDAYAKTVHQEEGPGPSFAQAIQVKKGQRFYLLIDNVYGGGEGYELAFKFFYQPKLFGQVIDAETKEPLDAKVYVEYWEQPIQLDSILTNPSDGKYAAKEPLEFKTDYKLVFTSDGYFTKVRKVNYPILRENRGKPINMALTPLKEGVTLTLEDINFLPGVADFTRATRPRLRETLDLMQRYPKMVVQLEGHVNGVLTPNCEQDTFSINLSWRRAGAVKRYLVENRIDPNRMTIKGFGCTQMLFPHSRKQGDMAKNRRVELKVIRLK